MIVRELVNYLLMVGQDLPVLVCHDPEGHRVTNLCQAIVELGRDDDGYEWQLVHPDDAKEFSDLQYVLVLSPS